MTAILIFCAALLVIAGLLWYFDDKIEARRERLQREHERERFHSDPQIGDHFIGPVHLGLDYQLVYEITNRESHPDGVTVFTIRSFINEPFGQRLVEQIVCDVDDFEWVPPDTPIGRYTKPAEPV